MGKILNTIIGNIDEKQAYNANEARAKTLPAEYRTAFNDIKMYLFKTAGLTTMKPLEVLVDILEDAAARSKSVNEVLGSDVTSFANELVKDEPSYKQKIAEKLNAKINTSPK